MTAIAEQPLSETLLRQAAEHSLRAFLEPNAIFLAERLHLMYPSDVSANLLATAHLRQGNFSRAAEVLHPATTPDNRYLYSVCLSRIGTPDALREAEAYLRGRHAPIDVAHDPSAGHASTPGGAAGLYLLGTICHRTGRRDEAISLYHRAVKENPTLWVAFEALANMGVVPKAEQILGTQTDAAALERLEAQPQFLPHVPDVPTPRRRNRAHQAAAKEGRPVSAPLTRSHASQPNGTHGETALTQQFRSPMDTTELHPSSFATPSPMGPSRGGLSFGDMMTPAALQSGARHFAPRRMGRNPTTPLHTSSRQSNRRSVSGLASHVRNPNDLFATPSSNSQPYSSRESVPGAQAAQPSAQIVDPKAQVSGTPTVNAAQQRNRFSLKSRYAPVEASQEEVGSEAMDVIRAIGQIVSELGRFRCSRTLELTENLPRVHRHSALILSIRGRAFLEKGDYTAAEQEFHKALHVEPTRLEGVVEYYSTVLWHLKKDKKLAQLAIRAHRVYPVSASAWCAAGNCFSLQKDPDTALRFFRKAISASKFPNAYAYTLFGHEHAAKENFEAALAAYRQALHIDERHYNALYGIGQVLQKQEKYTLASSHFRSAVVIHPLNATLHYHLGVALAASVHGNDTREELGNGDRDALIPALSEFETAANLDSKNPIPRFEKAKVFVAMNRLPDARRQLEHLRETLPKEAEVHFELSRVCRRMGDIHGALRALSIALDIEPKERKYKKALEALSNEVETKNIV